MAEGALFVAAFSFRGSEGLLNVAFLLSLLGVVPAIVMLVGNKGGPGSYRWAAATGLVLPLLVIVAYVALIIALMNALGY